MHCNVSPNEGMGGRVRLKADEAEKKADEAEKKANYMWARDAGLHCNLSPNVGL